MKKYLVAALVACLGILSVNAQVDKTIEVSQCEANNKLTVEGQTLISTSYGNLVFPENDYTNYTGINFEATNFEKLDENATNAICSLKIERFLMDFIPKARRRCNSVLLKMKKPVKLQLIQVLLPKFPLGWEKTKK